MSEINEQISHITCNLCGKQWQVLNEEGTDWDEQATAESYQSGQHICEPPQE
jgi:hypothetical protein